ncbi:hypothetical protein [Nocardia carnea]|uniref:hypothetical protein n=1 Tax=Nocardia carnea TaxID=37328 RepID=UPI002458E294|nr:hypothetical protein [Nocardia carnea]
MATAIETLQATLSASEYSALEVLAVSTSPLSGRKVASAMCVSPTTANAALSTLLEAGFATSKRSGRATLWQLAVSNPSISAWLEELMPAEKATSTGASPYSTGGGGVRLEHSYAACLIAAFLAGDALPELGDAALVDSIRLQASDSSDADDILIEGRGPHGDLHRSSIAVRRNPALTTSDSASVPLIRDFLSVVTDHWAEASSGRWRVVLAVSTNANAITQLAELAELAVSLPSSEALEERMTQPGRTNTGVRNRYTYIKDLVRQASKELPSAYGLSVEELTWRLLSSLSTRSLRLERTDRADRTAAVTTLQRIIRNGTPATADALFSRIEELVGEWAPQAAVLTQSVIRRRLSNYQLSRSARFADAWDVLDRLGVRLRESTRPALWSSSQSLEFERAEEKSRLVKAMRSVGISADALVVTGDPDLGKSALSLRAIEALQQEDAAVCSLSLRDLPTGLMDLESQLGGSAIEDVMAAGGVGPVRLLLVDGAESVLEGKGPLFRTVALAALRAGVGVVAVTRTDGSRQVSDELAQAKKLAGVVGPPDEHVVVPLSHDERQALPITFSILARLGSDPRASWLLGRPGLVDALLRTDMALDPAELLCEADVFSAVWRSLIRRDEVLSLGAASPDDREQAALSVAKRVLGIATDAPRGTGSAELRSDGVLRVPNNAAFSPGDEFATDLFRDFALCRLFITHGWSPLASAGAPRWSIRAARLGCQAALLDGSRLSGWVGLSMSFGEIARAHGDRWLEVPYEALLTLGDAEPAIRELWGTLTDNSCAALLMLLRLAEARYVDATIGDAFALAPLVKVAFCERPVIERSPRIGHRSIQEVIRDLVLAWLRGMATTHPQPHPLRQEVRDLVLDDEPPLYDAFAVEALASLGPDTDDRAEEWLRKVATDSPVNLNSAVESTVVAVSLSQARPKLLLELTEAYYIQRPRPRGQWGGGAARDSGIRDLHHGSTGLGPPQAAWYYGPFFRLLNTIPVDTIGFINRMLDHAARIRVGRRSAYGNQSGEPENLEGVQLDLLGNGHRVYVGDGHVWAWYRGTSVGPYPCMSALLALERFTDHLLEKLHLPAQAIIGLLLRDCQNLAVPGLVVGFLARHPDAAGTLLDPFLASPAIWHLDISRVTGDYGFRVRDADADRLTGFDRRKYTFHEIVGEMVINARLTANDERLAQLQLVGLKLIETARAELGNAGADAEYLAVVESWAEEFRFENYRLTRHGDQVAVQFERPEQIRAVLAPHDAEIQTTNTLYELQNRYAHHNDDPNSWPIDRLGEDLATARRLADDQAPDGILWPENALVAVAAAAVRAHAIGLATLDASNVTWAADTVLWAAENPQIDGMSHSSSMFSMGADRAAAASAPLLLLAPFDDLELDRSRVENSIQSLATSLFDEVRSIYVRGCELVWVAPCEIDKGTCRCRRHQPAWDAATAGLIDCKLGPWNQETQRRKPDSLPMPFHESLLAVPHGDLMVNRLRMPLACMVDARQATCLEGAVNELWAPLWDAHRRGLAHWWKEGYDHQEHITHEPIAQRMIQIALDGDRGTVEAHIATFAANSQSLHMLFDGFKTVFTYNRQLRQSIADFWPWALESALDNINNRTEVPSQDNWFDYMTAALLPTPHARSWDPDIDGTLSQCRESWLEPSALGTLGDRWLRLARWEPKAVDAVIKFAKCAPLQWQTTTALAWIESIIDGRYDRIANHLWLLEEWLTELRGRGTVVGNTKSLYHRIVDGLAAAGDRAAVRIQQLDE